MDEYVVAGDRQDERCESRGDEIGATHEDPEPRFLYVLHDQLVGWQRCPSHMVETLPGAAPLHPGGAPFVAGHPAPAELVVEYPPAVVVRHPAPFRLRLVRDPVPAPVVGVDPTAQGVRPPVARPVRRRPDLAPAGVPPPAPVRLQCGTKLGLDRAVRSADRLTRLRRRSLMPLGRCGRRLARRSVALRLRGCLRHQQQAHDQHGHHACRRPRAARAAAG